MVIISPKDSRCWQVVSIQAAKRFTKKIKLYNYYDECWPTRAAFCFTSNSNKYYELPKEFNFLFDSIKTRCQYRSEEIKESLFDDEDIHMSNLDKIADTAYIKRLLKKDDFDDFEKSIDEVENMIKKNHVKIPASKIDYGNKYIEFIKGHKYSGITIYTPCITNVKKLDILQICFSDTNRFRVFRGRTKSEARSNAIGQFYRTIYELPKEYEWMIEWFKEEFNKNKK